ncbi:sulfonate ABC transporter permease [Anaerocolumna cellulosilytica]|uniref:Sulfonate ABC transporter permease n=1 Tax=Anaerocolumna cellulosilytica TaxID=433286 RepID=A0A6S6R932_9FIRM|nr:ABC transporter permease [Anaerocolumna cellulosilytica]MBB5196845.1 NitT/TauT family transport system permease protein [Anaerocolumna cellulosilytica]BCJ95762.1 sulfonate ABC transporter permease [Anaerocolumna cellulosilytica]
MKTTKKKLLSQTQLSISPSHEAYIREHLKNIQRIRFFQVIIIVGFIALWEVSTRVGLVDSFIFSSPSRVSRTFFEMARDGSIFYHIGVTLLETFLSFTLVIVLGIALAILLWWNHNLAKILEPYLVVLNSLPKSALAPVFIVWLGNNIKTIIVAAVSVAVFSTVITLYTAFIGVEEDKVKLIRTLGGSKKDILLKVVIPSNIPSMISIMKVNIGLSLVGVIIGEFLAAKAGLGYLIIYGSQVFKLDWVIMSIVILCILATALYQLLSYFEKRYK